MYAEFGHFALILAFTLSLAQSSVPLFGAYYRDRKLMEFGTTAAIGQLVFIAISFAVLTYAYVNSDFSLQNVTENSNSAMPLIYRFTATWGNHEGSMLLWVLILAIFGSAVAFFGGNLPVTLKARVLGIQGMVGAGFLAFILFTSNPFWRVFPAPMDGTELNPMLQDIGLAIHPPFLYLGYVGFSMAFSFSVAALSEGRIYAAWARWVRPWVLAAWCFLTIGITLGSYWAYYELGWGGWWFWDPVENASFMPWLAGTALLHSALVMERRQSLVNWTILLGLITFSLSLIGTFIVRSGIITSVHAFASDPSRGVFILALLALAAGGALTIFALRAPGMRQSTPFSPVSRESSLVLNNVILISATAVVMLGTFYPLLVKTVAEERLSVGAPYYNLTFVPMMLVLMAVLVIGPILKWKRDRITEALGKLKGATIITLVCTLVIMAATMGEHIYAALSLGLGIWVILGSFAALSYRIKLFKVSFSRSWEMARTTPRSVYGLFLGHAGMGFMALGITVMTVWQHEELGALKSGGQLDLGSYQVTLDEVKNVPGPNYQAERATFTITSGGETISSVFSERRFYPVRGMQTTEAGIYSNGFVNVYVAIGEQSQAGIAVRAYYHPGAPWIWFGPFIMAIAGFVSLTDRRLRVGAPQRSKTTTGEASLAPAE
ncbi:MAG: heme lyase CcmF/NrfE family subunit [Hyphomicrobiales bacterium]|nr:heme lyase CcmF/NrfE family subunit [Hyphomicrobiales bacterium]